MTTHAVLAAEREVIAYASRRGARPAPQAAIDAAATEFRLIAGEGRCAALPRRR